MNKILIPAMQIIDWPDIPNRGVVWCYRNSARTVSSSMKSLVRLFSSLRINQLYLAIDAYNSESLNQLPPDSLQVLSFVLLSTPIVFMLKGLFIR